MPNLSKPQLLRKILESIDLGGWQSLVLDANHPFHIKVYQNDNQATDLHIYIWNCTHGGGQARADDEYRIQLTGAVPTIATDGITLLLGWHDGYQVFIGFDITRHNNQATVSPSIQIKEETLLNAHANSFSTYDRTNGEVAVAFTPDLLVPYAINSHDIHVNRTTDLDLLDRVYELTTADIETIPDTQRRTIVATINRRYRENNFRNRVLAAYSHRCAMCGIQLNLIDAAHILPVADSTSTDDTSNGIALCALHHRAYDRNLVSFDENYRVEISNSQVQELRNMNLIYGLNEFQSQLRPVILLPPDRRDYPNPALITLSRTVRRWTL